MKEWFKYEFGYVNIDSENIYLTSTGIWSEARGLCEKTKEVNMNNKVRNISLIGFMLATFCGLVLLMLNYLLDEEIMIGLLILIGLGGYKLFKYKKTEIDTRFKIPFNKISEINVSDQSIEFIFVNGEGEPDQYKLVKVEEKGIEIINRFKTYFDSY